MLAPEMAAEKERDRPFWKTEGDLWGLGLLIYHATTGQELDPDLARCGSKALREEIQRKVGDAHLREAIAECLNKNPFDRPDIDSLLSRINASWRNQHGLFHGWEFDPRERCPKLVPLQQRGGVALLDAQVEQLRLNCSTRSFVPIDAHVI